MSFSVGTLGNYTRENEQQLVTSLVFAPKTAEMITSGGNLQTGIKSTEKINILETDAIFQTGGSCGFNASGATTFTQRTITVGKIKVHEALCPKDLETKYTQKLLQAGTAGLQYDTLTFAADYTGKKIGKIGEQLETAIWKGDTSSGDVNLNKFDGFLKLIVADTTAIVNANATAYYGTPLTGGFTAATVINAAYAVYKAIPTQQLNRADNVIFMGWDTFRMLGVAFNEGKYFVNWGEGLKTGEIMLPNTNVKCVAVNGLNTSSYMVATYLENLYLGTDMENEEEKFELFWAKEADQMRFMAEWKYGVQYAFPEAVVKFNAA